MRAPNFTVDQEDGARWAVYEDPDDPTRNYTILTSAGQGLMRDDERRSELRSLAQQYRTIELGGIAILGEDPDIRQELGRGKEAIVYSMGPYAVREKIGIQDVYRSLGELERMDAINGVIERGLPRWLNLPAHYALHANPDTPLPKTYTLMDRVNSGTTAEDIIEYPNISPERFAQVRGEMGEEGVEEAKEHVPVLFDQAHDILAEAIREVGQEPGKLLTDWEPRNALIEKLDTPVAGSDYSLSVIDQYRP